MLAPATTSGKNLMPRVAALLDVMQITDIIAVESRRHVHAADLCRQRDRDGAVEGPDQGHHRARHRLRAGDGDGGTAPIEAVEATGAAGLTRVRRRRAVEIERPELTSARVIVSGGRGMQSGEKFHAARTARRQARRRGRRVARRGRCRLCAERLSGRPDRQDRRAGALYRGRHLGRDPAPRRHEGFEGHRRDQQGRGGADLPGRRLRPGRRPVQDRAGADEELGKRQQ